MSERVCYRYRTTALHGPWRRLPDTAHRDAVNVGLVRPTDDGATWLVVKSARSTLPIGLPVAYADSEYVLYRL